MLIRLECGSVFEHPRVVLERHGLDTPPYEEMRVCPRCERNQLRPAYRCDVCGEWITGGYIRTLDGSRICDECYTRHDAEYD